MRVRRERESQKSGPGKVPTTCPDWWKLESSPGRKAGGSTLPQEKEGEEEEETWNDNQSQERVGWLPARAVPPRSPEHLTQGGGHRGRSACQGSSGRGPMGTRALCKWQQSRAHPAWAVGQGGAGTAQPGIYKPDGPWLGRIGEDLAGLPSKGGARSG